MKKTIAKKTPSKKPAIKKVAKKASAKTSELGNNVGELISEIFGQLNDTATLSNLMKDYFFTELLKRGVKENAANTIANKLIVNVDVFEANIDIEE